ncbi:hypothetical protein [Flexivirga caeni]|nr:hypothetical protein [Flexivirga caeni]
MMNHIAAKASTLTTAVCPKAPKGASGPVNDIKGYVMWGVIVLFFLGIVVGIGGVVAGRVFSMPHASKVALVGLAVVFLAAIGYKVLPAMLNGIMGSGCI